MPKSMTVRVVGSKSRRKRYSRRPRGFPYKTFGASYTPRGTAEGIARFGNTWATATPEQQAARRQVGYYGNGLYSGRGGFWGDLWSRAKEAYSSPIGQMVRTGAGTLARSGLLGPTGALVGGAMGALGVGDYETGVVSNDIVNGGQGTGIPSFGPSGANIVTITHKEYICDIFGPENAGTFQNQTFSLNPALATSFPWLSQIAANFDEYTFGQLMFTFRSTVTDFVAANGQVGTVILATQYNAEDTPFASKQDAMEYDGAVSGKCSQEIIAGVECDPAQNSGSYGKYCRAGPVPGTEDVKTYDLGTLNVGVSNTPAGFSNQALGELWVSYTVQLRKPKFFVTRGLSLPTDIWVAKTTTNIGTIITAQPLGSLTLGQGQQNRVGSLLVKSWASGGVNYPVDTGTLYLVLPQYFTGDVDIRLNSSMAIGTTIPYITGYSNSGTGINPISDIFEYTGWVSEYGNKNPTSTVVPTSQEAALGYHYRITSPATAQTLAAQDNVFTIKARDPATLVDSTMYSLQVTIQVYNSGMNYARLDQPVIMNPDTSIIEQWP